MKDLPVAELSDDKFEEELEKLRAEIRSKNNTYVNDVLARGAVQACS